MPVDDRLWMNGHNLYMVRTRTRHSTLLGRKEPQCQRYDAPSQLPALHLGTAVAPGRQRRWSNTDSLKYLCPQGDADLVAHRSSGCQAQPPYGREMNRQHVLNRSHNLLLAKRGTCRGSHTRCHSQALLSLPCSSFVTPAAQVLQN